MIYQKLVLPDLAVAQPEDPTATSSSIFMIRQQSVEPISSIVRILGLLSSLGSFAGKAALKEEEGENKVRMKD